MPEATVKELPVMNVSDVVLMTIEEGRAALRKREDSERDFLVRQRAWFVEAIQKMVGGPVEIPGEGTELLLELEGIPVLLTPNGSSAVNVFRFCSCGSRERYPVRATSLAKIYLHAHSDIGPKCATCMQAERQNADPIDRIADAIREALRDEVEALR